MDEKKVKEIELKDTIDGMISNDYKERFKAEYNQLRIRIHGLSTMLHKYKNGTLSFTPQCSYNLLSSQLMSMELYAEFLEQRADIEKIELKY